MFGEIEKLSLNLVTYHQKSIYSQTSMARTPLEPQEDVPDRASSSE